MENESKGVKPDLSREVAARAARKLKARQKKKPSVWASIGIFGLVGWSVVVPTLLGAALGVWLDRRFPSVHSWTLTFLIIGIVAGCLNAAYWVRRENKAIHKDMEDGT